jgi:hypothetical protein
LSGLDALGPERDFDRANPPPRQLMWRAPPTPVLAGETGHGWLERVARAANLQA